MNLEGRMGLSQFSVLPRIRSLETRLLDDPTYRSRVEKLLSYPTALKTYMRRLKTARPDLYDSAKVNGRNEWRISSVPN